MAIYEVQVSRIGYGFSTLRVQAESQAEAEEKAIDEAGDVLFSEKDSDYEVVGVTMAEEEG